MCMDDGAARKLPYEEESNRPRWHMLPPRQLQPSGSPWLGDSSGSLNPQAPATPPGHLLPVQGGSDDARDWWLRRILQQQWRQQRLRQTMEE